MSEQFTPGTWEAFISDPTNKNLPFTISTTNELDEIKVFGPNKKRNAHLIAAAPDMYEALTDVLVKLEHADFGKSSPLLKPSILKIKAALSKATPKK